MQCRLVYQGRLPAASTSDKRSGVKQRIRQQLHPQLKELWHTHPVLTAAPEQRIMMNRLNEKNNIGAFRFLPLVGEHFGRLVCRVDVLFLRRDIPGNLIQSGGDIDNRLKVLFDALRMPNSLDELARATPGPDEDPFYCLLQDDRLITEFSVITDRLLTPKRDTEAPNDVHLILHVTTIDLKD